MRKTSGFTRTALIMALAIWIAIPASAAELALFGEIDGILQSLSEITGWKVKKHVKAGVLTREQFRREVEQRIKKNVKPEEVRIESLTLRMFGFVPESYNLVQNTVDLLSEQTAAYYDYDRKRLFLLDAAGREADVDEDRIALVHELAHALADQHFSLKKYTHKGAPSDDASSARQAVMEGQATWLMWAWSAKNAGGKAEVSPGILAANADFFRGTGADNKNDKDASDLAKNKVFDETPLYIRESMVFPYVEGLKFQEAVYRKMGQRAFTAVFSAPPASTQQILHSDAYFDRRNPLSPAPPAPPKTHRLLGEGTLGELDLALLLRQHAGEATARSLSSSMRGGSFLLSETKTDKKPLLTFVTEWSSADMARKFFEAYPAVLRSKWKKLETKETTASVVRGEGDYGPFELRLEGARVISLEGTR